MREMEGVWFQVSEAAELRLAAETAMVLGFHSVSQEFPVAGSGISDERLKVFLETTDGCSEIRFRAGKLVISAGREDGICQVMENLHQFLEEQGEALGSFRRAKKNVECESLKGGPKPVSPEDWRGKKGLESLFEPGDFFKDQNGDLLADACDFLVVVPEECCANTRAAILNFAFRLGMETTAYELPVFTTKKPEGSFIEFTGTGFPRMRLEEEGNNQVIFIDGRGSELLTFMTNFCNQFPVQSPGFHLAHYMQDLVKGAALKNGDGQLALLELTEGEGQRECFVYPELFTEKKELESLYPDAELHSVQELVPVWEQETEFPWEVDILRELLEKHLFSKAKPGDQVEVWAAVSEPPEVRRKLKQEFSNRLHGCDAELHVISAYKQGLSWLEEAVVPVLSGRSFTDESRIEIAFKPFLKDPAEGWATEDGAVPSYHNIGDAPEHWNDLPIRFLQELYPADDILANKLSISRDQVIFKAYDGNEDITYQVTALEREGGEPMVMSFKVPVEERPYLDEYPGLGLVHPSPAWCFARINGTTVTEQTFQTDTGRVWDHYQRAILPACRAYADKKTGGQPKRSGQPIFARLSLEINISEPDYRMGFREDLCSSLDALFEDLYFAGLDFFKNYGMKYGPKELLDAPGLIYPVIHNREGRPAVKAVLYEYKKSEPCVTVKGKALPPRPWGEETQFYVREISFENGKNTFRISAESDNRKELKKFLRAYGKLLEAGRLSGAKGLSGNNVLVFDCGAAGEVSVSVPESPKPLKDLSVEEVPMYENKLVGYEEYLEVMEHLKRVPGISVERVGISYEGRLIYGVRFLTKRKGYVSRVKLLTQSPSEYINARHHANEVSSTNAAFLLIRRLLTDPQYRELPERLNLMIVPMENPDGASIHYELQKEHPYWKLHIARYNALGKEFAHEYFNPHTIHREASAARKIWYDLLPDVQVDNHGVPSHEWEQPFSGYTPPAFKGFWLPRSLLYGYFWSIGDREYAGNETLNKQIEKAVAEAVNQSGEAVRWNKEWAERFEKYAHRWLPKLFPADYYQGMINYWIYYPYTPDHTYNSVKYPWITTVCYTSEAADETAQGEYLGLCADIHCRHDIAVIDLLLTNSSVYQAEAERRGERLALSCIRTRPVICREETEGK